jgi:hypothetical protein
MITVIFNAEICDSTILFGVEGLLFGSWRARPQISLGLRKKLRGTKLGHVL